MNEIYMINDDDYTGSHKIFGCNNLMVPALCMVDCVRGQMESSHYDQMTQITNAQPCLVFTRFENELSKNSSGYLELKGQWKVIRKIIKNDFSYALIIKKIELSKDEKSKKVPIQFKVGTYQVIFRHECEWLTEKYGYKNINDKIDSLNPGQVFKDEVLFRDLNRDSDMNLQVGMNLNVIYKSDGGKTTEDAIIVSRRVAEKYRQPFVYKVQMSLNTNDIPVNLYGNEKFYKAFPDIGEEIKNGILCASRRIHYETSAVALSKMTKSFAGDASYKIKDGIVVDVEVISNMNEPEREFDKIYNKQIGKYWRFQRSFYERFIEACKKIVTEENIKKGVISDTLMHFYNRYSMLLDDNIKFRIDGNLFDHIIVNFTIYTEHPLVVGSKLTGRYGNKGVISEIREDEDMPKISDFAGFGPIREDSKIDFHIDAILNPLGVPNRINPAQLMEQEMNYCSFVVRYNIEEALNSEDYEIEDIMEYFLEYLSNVNQTQYEFTKKYLNDLYEKDVERVYKFFEEIVETGIPIYQPPFWNSQNIIDLKRIYEFTEADYSYFEGNENKMIFGQEYFIALKHLPESKFSARSVDRLSIKNLPVKSTAYKQYKTNFSTTPIKLGEMEVIGLNVANTVENHSMTIVKNFLDDYANNDESRNAFLEAQLTANPFSFTTKPSETLSENSKILKSFLRCLQLELVDD